MASQPFSSALTERRSEPFPQATRGYSINQYGDTYVDTGAQVHQGDQHYHFESDPHKEEIKRMLELLSFPEIHSRFDSIPDAERGTYEWILDPDVKPEDWRDEKQRCLARFSQWYFHGHGIFWVSGKPGSGKSTLTKHLLQKTISTSAFRPRFMHCASFAFFFWLNGTPLQRSVSGCVRSLLCQLLQNETTAPSAVSVLRPLMSNRYCWTDNRLQEAVCSIFIQAKISTLIWLDGLDESDSPRECLKFLDELKNVHNLKICASSRPEQIFVDGFEGTLSIRLQDMNEYDIFKMIRKRFFEDPQVRRIVTRQNNQAMLEKIAKNIVEKADGVFLWAHIVVKDVLEGVSSRDDLLTLQRRVERMPGDMIQLYKSMLGRGGSTAMLHTAQAALYFRLALKLNGHRDDCSLLAFALMIDDDVRKGYLMSVTPSLYMRPTWTEFDPEIIEAWVNTRTSGLLHVTQPSTPGWRQYADFERLQAAQVSFIHRTAADFFRDGEGCELLGSCPLPEEQIMHIIFEARLVEKIVVPYLQKKVVSVEDVKRLCSSSTDMLPYSLLHATTMTVWSGLVESGSLILECKYCDRNRDFSINFTIATLPSSRYAAPDFAQMMARAGRFRYLEMWLDAHSCWHDIDYTSSLLAPVLSGISECVRFPGELGSSTTISEGKTLWDGLITSGAVIYQKQYDSYGDFCYPLFHLVVDLCFLTRQSIVPFPALPSSDNPIRDLVICSSLPSCHEIWFQNPTFPHSSYVFFWGDFTLKDVLEDGSQLPMHSGRIKVTVVAFTMYHVTGEESERSLRETTDLQGSNCCHWELDVFTLKPASAVRIGPLTCDSPCDYTVITSFEAAMRILKTSRGDSKIL